MRSFVLLLFFFVLTSIASAQDEKPVFQHFSKGKTFWGVGISPVYSDMLGAYTDVSIRKNNTSLGILIAPMYGKFVQQNFMVGLMGIAGFHTEQNKYLTYPITIGFPPFFPNVETKDVNNNLDLGLVPITRYYFNLNRRNSIAFFLQAGLPAVYSKYTNSTTYKYVTGSVDRFSGQYDEFSVRGSIGFGLSVQGKMGSFDTHVSNMGWFLSFNKLLSKK
ncbi:hypothetical protein [Sediminibacterium sp. TEGAF015]|uniref:hypothetical protein n=1 Tax=Sediminibacterium sp. TEGAF015 TaxID=575378 RepID=UPI0021FEAC82|nr:hypothetical protein [Sediminibacterium sp. TEGAF015]BDQ11968.1 hypothetical protein TEGAF0_11850 [Sediminibacterium sp. TEGAF015]